VDDYAALRSAKLRAVEVGVRLTVVGSQTEADIVCSLLRANGIRCGDRAADVSVQGGGGFGGWREIVVSDYDLDAARELIATESHER
jgi:hypothetical protein